MMDIDKPERIQLPGFGLPVNTLPKWGQKGEQERFPHAISDYLPSSGVTVRERRMLEFMNQITDKPEWERKIFDQDIVAKWEKEAVQWDENLPEKGDWWLSQKMFDVCVEELREKAQRFKEVGFVPVLDAEATIVKSDVLVGEELRKSLKKSIRKLEDVPDRLKDWHPGSDEKVLDLVHPSLFPVVYGLTRALPTGAVSLQNCAEYCGKGETIPEFSGGVYTVGGVVTTTVDKAWGTFQWLPANVKFADDGTAKIDSYINNLHPQKHTELYSTLERFVDAAIPLWNECLSWFHSRMRIEIPSSGRDDWKYPEGAKFPREQFRPNAEEEYYEPASSDEELSDRGWADENGLWDDYENWHNENKILQQHEPIFIPRAELETRPGARPIDLRNNFKERGLQIIFKLANIHLTPDKPNYDGGSWHVEGSLNEHICATALYYYDCENVTDSRLSFRQGFDSENMMMKPEQNEHESTEAYYGVQQDGHTIMQLGSVLTRPNRLLAFPNVMQHQVQPFSLRDPSNPGHRKILAMFLIDPHVPILSTANVPPQRKDWWADEVRKIERFAVLPEEIFDMIVDAVEDFPISWGQALEYRENLMKERGAAEDLINDNMESDRFFFCEH